MANTATLTAVITPPNAANQNVTWESSAPEIASVSPAGLVTAISAGAALITATTEDGGYTASCNVTVTASVTGITVTPGTLNLTV